MLDLLKFGLSAQDRNVGGTLKGLKSDLGGVKGALAGVNDYARRAGRSMRNIGAGMSAAVTAPLTLLGKESIQLYDTQVRAETAVAQAIRSTGAAAGKTLGDLKGLASGLQSVTTFGDEDILQNVTAPLLTFTKVQGDVFDRAQANVLDMATLLKMDLKSASILVGKALNDPIKGVSALSRSGVQFSEDQKKMIKALVETGDVAGAQALVLKELETQFKGQAQAAAQAPLGQWRQLSNAIGDVKEELGAQIVPFLKPLVENVQSAVDWFAQLGPEVKKNVVVFGGIAAAAGPVLGFLGLAAMGVSSLTGALSAMGAALLANPIIAVIAAIAGGAYLVWRNWEAISGWFSGLWERLKSGASAGWSAIKTAISAYAPDWLKTAWGALTDYYAGLWSLVLGAFRTGWDAIKGLLDGTYSPAELIHKAWSGLGDWFAGLAPQVKDGFVQIWEAIKSEVGAWPGRMIDYGKNMVQGLIDGLLSMRSEVGSAGRNVARGAAKGVKDESRQRSPSRVFMELGSNMSKGLAIGIRDSGKEAIEEMRGLTADLASEGEKAQGFLGDLRSGVMGVARDVLSGTRGIGESLKALGSQIGSTLFNTGLTSLFDIIWPFAKGGVVSGGSVKAFADGGVVGGPTYFGMRGGTGLMGEAGPEAIMPLKRLSGGRLGVSAEGGGGGRETAVTQTINIDARGAQAGVAEQIAEAVRGLRQEMPQLAVQAVYSANREQRFT